MGRGETSDFSHAFDEHINVGTFFLFRIFCAWIQETRESHWIVRGLTAPASSWGGFGCLKHVLVGGVGELPPSGQVLYVHILPILNRNDTTPQACALVSCGHETSVLAMVAD